MSDYTESIHAALLGSGVEVSDEWSDDTPSSEEEGSPTLGYLQFLADVGDPPDETYALVFFGAANTPYESAWGKRTATWGRDTSLDRYISPRRQRHIDVWSTDGKDPRLSKRPTMTTEGLA